jgi:hypothetical protein
LDPTEITVEITTTFDCPSLRTGLLDEGYLKCIEAKRIAHGPMLTQNGGWWDVPIPEAVANIGAGRAHNCALTVSGAVYCWGAAPAGPGSNQPKRIVL